MKLPAQRSRSVLFLSLSLSLVLLLPAHAAEPTYAQAVVRWPDMRRPIAFLGCKNHPFEFGVMWNGNISATPGELITEADRLLFTKTKADAALVSFSIGERPDFEHRRDDDGSTEPSLLEGDLPISEVKMKSGNGVLLEEALAVDSQGNASAAAWDSPVFLRLRLKVIEPGSGATAIHLWIQIASDRVFYAMNARRNVRIPFVAPKYPHDLRASGLDLVDETGRIVLTASKPGRYYSRLQNEQTSLGLIETGMDANLWTFEIPRRTGAALDLILPFSPADAASLRTLRGISYDQSRASVVNFWKAEEARGMQVDVPDPQLNRLWNYTVPLSFITADTYPNGDHVLKTSPHHYEAYWPTPMSLNLVDLIERGYLTEAKSFLEPFLDTNRYSPVPSSSAWSTAGYISGPREHLAIPWTGDHGAILWAASEYYLMSRDREFLKEWLPKMIKGVEWIADERNHTRLAGGPDAGLMPAARGFDGGSDDQHLAWIDAWMYRALASVTEVLQSIHYKDAERWARERDDYRECFQAAYRKHVERTVRWKDASGEMVPFIPWSFEQTDPKTLHIFYVDCGPMFLGVAGLLNANDPIMTLAMKWLNEGPNAGSADPDWTEFTNTPTLRYEMSSVEPCYSWNIYLRFLRNERDKFLEGFYSLAAGSVSRKFMGGDEHRDGIQDLPTMNSVIDNHLRNMLVFENEGGKGLDLLRNSPSAWLLPEKDIRVRNALTVFGTLSFQVHSSEKEITATIECPKNGPAWLHLYLNPPPGEFIETVKVNGLTQTMTNGIVEIPNASGTVHVAAELQRTN